MASFQELCKVCSHVFIYDDIDPAFAVKFKTKVDDAHDSIKKDKLQGLMVHVSSVGGDTTGGSFIFNYLSAFPYPVYTVNDGAALSMAAILFMIGKRRFMFKNSILMFHGARFQSDALLRSVSLKHMLDSLLIDDNLDKQVLSKGVISKGKIQKLLDTDRYLDHFEAGRHRFATDIITCSVSRHKLKHDVQQAIGISDIAQPCDNLESTIHKLILSEDVKSKPVRLLIGLDLKSDMYHMLTLSNYLCISDNAICTAVSPVSPFGLIALVSAHYRLGFSYSSYSLAIPELQDPHRSITDVKKSNYVINAMFKKILTENTNIPSTTINKLEERPLDLDAHKALEWQIIDGIIPSL